MPEGNSLPAFFYFQPRSHCVFLDWTGPKQYQRFLDMCLPQAIVRLGHPNLCPRTNQVLTLARAHRNWIKLNLDPPINAGSPQ